MITTCTRCGNAYESGSEEQANEPGRFCPTCSLRQQLAGANAEIEKYRLREWACYQALGYSEPTNQALPHLIESMMGLKARLQDSLAAIERATGFQPGAEPLSAWVDRMVKERDVAQKACAEMRSELGRIKSKPWAHVLTEEDRESIARILSSTDCGKDYVPRAEVDRLKAENKALVEAIGDALIEWPYCNERLKKALDHVKQFNL